MGSKQSVVIRSNLYYAAGEAASIRMMKETIAALESPSKTGTFAEKLAGLEMFQIDVLLSVLKNSFAPILFIVADAKLAFSYYTMKKVLEGMREDKQKALQETQQDYQFGNPSQMVEDSVSMDSY